MSSFDRPDESTPEYLGSSDNLSGAGERIAVPPGRSGGVFRRLTHNAWRILILWLVISSVLTYGIYRFIQPMYQAYALVKIESSQPELFDHSLMALDGAGPTYLQTEIETIRANSVLDLVLSHAEIKSSPMFRDSLDPKAKLREKLVLEIVPNTNFIKIALESQDNKEATDIVNAVVDAYREISADTGTTYTKMTASKDLMKILIADLKVYKTGLSKKIEETREKLRDLAARDEVLADKGAPNARPLRQSSSPGISRNGIRM